MSTQTFTIGQEIEHKNGAWLVVRIVSSTSIVENHDKTVTKIEESYAQVRSSSGEWDFIIFTEHEEPFTSLSVIKPIPPVPWRIKRW